MRIESPFLRGTSRFFWTTAQRWAMVSEFQGNPARERFRRMNTQNTAQLMRERGYSMREAINAGAYYHVEIPHWASGGHDVVADSPDEAALLVGCSHAAMGFERGVALHTGVLKHLPGSTIGASYLERCGTFETLTANHYSI